MNDDRPADDTDVTRKNLGQRAGSHQTRRRRANVDLDNDATQPSVVWIHDGR